MTAETGGGGSGRPWLAIAAGGGLLAIVCCFFPPFRIVALDAAEEERQSRQFDPITYADEFWTEQLPGMADQATEASELVAALADDPDAAKSRYGRTMGIGDTHYFHVRGEGTILEVTEGESIGVSLDGGEVVQAVFPTGLLFSNAVRDATGRIRVSEFASSRHFNDVTSELNKRVETELLPRLREQAKPGVRLAFVACAEVTGEGDPLPLRVIPVAIDFP